MFSVRRVCVYVLCEYVFCEEDVCVYVRRVFVSVCVFSGTRQRSTASVAH